jgi:cysteine-rich repeat protein
MHSKLALAALLVVSSAAGFYGCSDPSETGSQGVVGADDHPTDTNLNLALRVVDKTGASVAAFEATGDVYLDIAVVDTSGTVVAQDFAFQIVDAQGSLLSSDAFDCRRFHVSGAGYIDRVYSGLDASGATCIHMYERTSSGHILIQLAPFKDAIADGSGAMQFTVKVAALASCGSDTSFHDALSVTFTVQPHQAACGDGTLDAGEECDDGNTANGDGCDATCNNEAGHTCGCGDGIVQEGEQCDDGNTTAGDGCSATCTSEPVCGDGHQDPGEQCDDGNTDNNDACRNDCTLCPSTSVCGNGLVESGEACDDGNTVDGDGCRNDCTVPTCGDGRQDAGEQCDDGNTDNNDTCRNDCTL